MMRQPLLRREFLKGVGKGAGVAIALPLLEATIHTPNCEIEKNPPDRGDSRISARFDRAFLPR